MDGHDEQELRGEKVVVTAVSAVNFEDHKKSLLDLSENLDQRSEKATTNRYEIILGENSISPMTIPLMKLASKMWR